MLRVLEVIWIYDTSIDPSKMKMVVCICPCDNLFYRINSENEYPIGVPIPKDPNHSFLQWDSYLQCGKDVIELDDYVIQKALAANGGRPIGRISAVHVPEICAAIQVQLTVNKATKQMIKNALGCPT